MADRKSTRLNSSHLVISYAVFCLKKKTRVALAYTPVSPRSMAFISPTRAPRGRSARELARHAIAHERLGGGLRQVDVFFFKHGGNHRALLLFLPRRRPN